MNLPTGHRGTLVAAGILLIPLILIGNYLVAPLWSEYLGLRSEITESRFQLGRFQRIADDLPQLKLVSRELREQALLAPYLVEGQSRSLAAANLQQHLREIAELHNARINSMRVGKPKQDSMYEEVPIEARIELPTSELEGFLFELESRQPLLFVTTLQINSKASRRRESAQAALNLTLNLHGLRIPDEDSGRV